MPSTSLNDLVAREREGLQQDLLAAPSMLSYEERAALHWAARQASPADGAIVDAGSFLGGSTLALAQGLNARPEPNQTRVHAYDLFVFGREEDRHWVPNDMPFALGATTLPVFERTVADVRDRIEVHEGDVRTVEWSGQPISVLFIDIAKSWDTADHVMRTFVGALVPGQSVIIQQDQVHWGHPWCAIAMELLADHVEFLGWVSFSSAVYRCTAPIPPDALPASLLEDVSLDEKLRLIDRFVERVGWPIGATVRLSEAHVLAKHREYDRARALVAELEAQVGDDQVPYLSEGYAFYHEWIDWTEVEQSATDRP